MVIEMAQQSLSSLEILLHINFTSITITVTICKTTQQRHAILMRFVLNTALGGDVFMGEMKGFVHTFPFKKFWEACSWGMIGTQAAGPLSNLSEVRIIGEE